MPDAEGQELLFMQEEALAAYRKLCGEFEVKKDETAIVPGRYKGNETVPTYNKLRIAPNVQQAFAEIVQEWQAERKADLDLADFEFVEYKPAYRSSSHEIEYVKLSSFPGLQEKLRQLETGSSYRNTEQFDITKRGARQASFYVVRQGKDADLALFFRRKKAFQTLDRSRYACLLDTKVYNTFRHMFVFDERIDFVVYKGYAFISSRAGFEFILRYLSEIQVKTRDIMQKIHDRVPIHDFDRVLAYAERNSRVREKLLGLEAGNFIDETLDLQSLQGPISTHSVQYRVVDGKVHVENRHIFQLINAIEEAYYQGSRTGRYFVATSKR